MFQFSNENPYSLRYPPRTGSNYMAVDVYKPESLLKSRRFVKLYYSDGVAIHTLNSVVLADDFTEDVKAGTYIYGRPEIQIETILLDIPEQTHEYIKEWLRLIDPTFYKSEVSELIVDWML